MGLLERNIAKKFRRLQGLPPSVPLKVLNPDMLIESWSNRTIFYNGDFTTPKHRIEIYNSGANRLVGSFGEVPRDTKPPKERIIHEFSTATRRRYFRYVNSLPLEGYNVNILVCTIQSDLAYYIDKEDLRKIIKNFVKKLIRMGFDYVYKLEYTAKEIPHLHILLYQNKRKIDFSSSEKRKKIYDYFSRVWTKTVFDCLYYVHYIDTNLDLKQIDIDMQNASCRLEPIKTTITQATHYFSFYTSKNKDYQNSAPQKYWGIRFWGRGNENYKLKPLDPRFIELTKSQYFRIVAYIQSKYESTGRTMYKFNNLYIPKDFLETFLETLSYDNTLSHEEYESKCYDYKNIPEVFSFYKFKAQNFTDEVDEDSFYLYWLENGFDKFKILYNSFFSDTNTT